MTWPDEIRSNCSGSRLMQDTKVMKEQIRQPKQDLAK
jgi:hypothetical protein